jgi:hypothetical protein
MSLCVHVCVCFFGGFGLLKTSRIFCVCDTFISSMTHLKEPNPTSLPSKKQTIFFEQRVWNDHTFQCALSPCVHMCVCVCVYTKQEFFIFQWYFAKETSNSIPYCKERNLHFIITFLHEKRAEPLALVHIGRNGRFQASHIQGRPWQFILFHDL